MCPHSRGKETKKTSIGFFCLFYALGRKGQSLERETLFRHYSFLNLVRRSNSLPCGCGGRSPAAQEAPAAQKKHHPPGTSCCEGSFRQGRAEHTPPEESEEALPAPATRPGNLQPGGVRLRCSPSRQRLVLTARLWHWLTALFFGSVRTD